MRDTQKMIDEGRDIMRKHETADLTIAEFKALVERHGDRVEAVNSAFLAGVAMGTRIAKREAKKKVTQ